MRLRIVLENDRATVIPASHQDLLTGLVYHLLESSDVDYSRFLHDVGYRLDGGPKRFKLFTYSQFRTQNRRMVGDQLHIGAGPVEWFVGSPVDDFLTHCATGLLGAGELRVGTARFGIKTVEALPAPAITGEPTRWVCLSPIVATVARPKEESRHPLYLRPADGEAFSRAVHENLARKHELVFGGPAAGDSVRLEFDQEYLERRRGGTKLIDFRGIQHVGAFAPFIATGNPALLKLGYECGFGEKNSSGFGMAEVRGKG